MCVCVLFYLFRIMSSSSSSAGPPAASNNPPPAQTEGAAFARCGGLVNAVRADTAAAVALYVSFPPPRRARRLSTTRSGGTSRG